MEYNDNNRGAIWPNDHKETENHPDYTGVYTSESGVEYWVSAWKRKQTDSDKAPVLRFTLNPKDAKPAKGKPKKQTPATLEFEDDIPF